MVINVIFKSKLEWKCHRDALILENQKFWIGTLVLWISPSSVRFSHSVVSDSLRPHESQHARPPCPSPTPGAYSNSCPSSQWCHPTISASVVPFFSCPQSLPASDSEVQIFHFFLNRHNGIWFRALMDEINFNVKTFGIDMFYVNARWYYCSYDLNMHTWYQLVIIIQEKYFPGVYIELVCKWLSSQLSFTSHKDKFMVGSYP